jgi:hypothetical protein
VQGFDNLADRVVLISRKDLEPDQTGARIASVSREGTKKVAVREALFELGHEAFRVVAVVYPGLGCLRLGTGQLQEGRSGAFRARIKIVIEGDREVRSTYDQERPVNALLVLERRVDQVADASIVGPKEELRVAQLLTRQREQFSHVEDRAADDAALACGTVELDGLNEDTVPPEHDRQLMG